MRYACPLACLYIECLGILYVRKGTHVRAHSHILSERTSQVHDARRYALAAWRRDTSHAHLTEHDTHNAARPFDLCTGVQL